MTMLPSGPEALQAQAETLLRRHRVTPFIEIRVEETVIFKKRYIGPGRPWPLAHRAQPPLADGRGSARLRLGELI